MKKRTSILKKILYVVLPLALIIVVVVKLKSNKAKTEEKVYQYDKSQALNVSADTVRLGAIDDELSFTGTFEANKETKLSADVQGKINNILVDVGSLVHKGQSLVQLDNALLQYQLQTVELQIKGLEVDVARFAILAEADAIQGVQLEKAQLGLSTAKVQRASLIEQISKTTVKAPFAGVVTAKLNEVGGFAAPGQPLLQITEIAVLRFTVNVPEGDLGQFTVGNPYSIVADAYPTLELRAKATMIGSKANVGSSFPVQFTLQNTPDLKIKAGMFGKVAATTPNTEEVIAIPTSAMLGTEGNRKVYIVKNGKVFLQPITVGRRNENKAIIDGGLKIGDVFVTNGLINLFDSANVIVK